MLGQLRSFMAVAMSSFFKLSVLLLLFVLAGMFKTC